MFMDGQTGEYGLKFY